MSIAAAHHSPLFFFFNDTATTEIYALSLHDALPIYRIERRHRLLEDHRHARAAQFAQPCLAGSEHVLALEQDLACRRSEEHTSETPVTLESRMPSSA